MIFDTPLQTATLIKRYKRFLADVVLEDATETTIYCANTGAMTGCGSAGDTIFYSTSSNKKRKYQYTWEFTLTQKKHLICVNTAKANALVAQAIEQQNIPELLGYQSCKAEVKYGEENSRIDFLLSSPNKADCYVEVKSCTLLDEREQAGDGYFPDAVTTRGQKHLRELIEMKQQGFRSVLLFAILHSGIQRVNAAHFIDKKYTDLFEEAKTAGVEVILYKPDLSIYTVGLNLFEK
ncbi:DNA/RNA nuclease SfsA [Psychromonas sp. RZ22]|uniref:DNA/RNA nuclease SfsA n=1 Tax=Psychromonas algarum TaxID=2555643 RepID=UPI001067CCF2|nr:DNA/RNA nuclease SfsA [Psychromonas sp. RZ22]TEW55548.1 DNA/RNA nuclease SfsA [Psychromonas sp. RZ22]